MVTKRIWLFFALLLGLAACSSHGENGGVVPQTMERSQVAALNPATSCIIDPTTVLSVPTTTLVAAASQTDAWSIIGLTLQHFTGGVWRLVPPPTIPNQNSYVGLEVDKATATATNDVWIAAEGVNKDQSLTLFFLHWNGSTWAYVPSAPTLTHPYRILALQGSAPNNVWAIVAPTSSFVATSIQLERWDGTHWSPGPTYSNASGIVGTGSDAPTLQVFGTNDLWASIPVDRNAAVLHWNGSILLQDLLQPSGLNVRIAGTADNDLWLTTNFPLFEDILRHTSVWVPYNSSLVSNYQLGNIVDFRRGYVLITALDPQRTPALLVYNGYVRWRPTSSPWPSFANVLGDVAPVKNTTSFWTTYSSASVAQASVSLVKCPSTPPAPL